MTPQQNKYYKLLKEQTIGLAEMSDVLGRMKGLPDALKAKLAGHLS